MTDEQREARMAAIAERLDADRSRKTEKTEDHGYTDDAGDQARAQIVRDREIRRFHEKRDAELAQREYEMQLEDEIVEQEAIEEQARLAEQENILEDSAEVLERFEEEFSDVWENESIRQALFDALDLRIGEEGRDPLDYRTYEELGEHFRYRLGMIEQDSANERLFEREDRENRLRVKRLREIDAGNVYFNRTLEKPMPADNSPEAIGETFKQEFPDVVQTPLGMTDAIMDVDERLKDSYIETGREGVDYEAYRESGENARRRNALREMAASRGQDPENI